MRKELVFSVLIAALLFGCINQERGTLKEAPKFSSGVNVSDTTSEISLQLDTDKEAYTARSTMVVSLRIDSNHRIENASVTVFGLTNKHGINLLKQVRTLSLDLGANYDNFTASIPSCSLCSGLAPGENWVNATVFVKGSAITNASKKITILEKS
ncbi:hypothetical protein HY991_03825 [Candidatus Micrarchaeota archaeon]|nr:hypothetical protein [Candidatus Micrarchaeota archaeon]